MTRSMKGLLAVWIVALVGITGWVGWGASHGGRSAHAIGGPFSLTDQNGHAFTEANLKGKPTLLYFGYTFCPDVCPTSLLLMENAVEILGSAAAQKVNIVFITVDPERDTPKVLKGFVASFGPTIVGLTGTSDQVAAAAKAYKVYYQKVPGNHGAPYLMDHSSVIYLLDRYGRLVRPFSHEAKAENIAKALRAEL